MGLNIKQWRGQTCYLFDIKEIKNYSQKGTVLCYPAVPIVNIYDSPPLLVRLGARIELAKTIQINQPNKPTEEYKIIKFLSVQSQNEFELLSDENEEFDYDNLIHIKPHYAIEPNGLRVPKGTVYRHKCRSIVYDGVEILTDILTVHVHDGLASPPQEMPGLRRLFNKDKKKIYILPHM